MDFDERAKHLIDSMCNYCIRRILTLTQSCQKIYLNKAVNIYNKNEVEEEDVENAACGICFGILGRFTSKAFLNEV